MHEDIMDQIDSYIKSLDADRRIELERLHLWVMQLFPDTRLWFLNGKNEIGKIVANPNIGYGFVQLHRASGKERDFLSTWNKRE